jgi:hypothetical protein
MTERITAYYSFHNDEYRRMYITKPRMKALIEAVQEIYGYSHGLHMSHECYGKAIEISFEGVDVYVYLKRQQDLAPRNLNDWFSYGFIECFSDSLRDFLRENIDQLIGKTNLSFEI